MVAGMNVHRIAKAKLQVQNMPMRRFGRGSSMEGGAGGQYRGRPDDG